jgi:hypothetical protein
MEHERGAFKVNRELTSGAVKNRPEKSPTGPGLAHFCTLRCQKTVPEI